MQRTRRKSAWLLVPILAMMAIALLIFFEWLGSEKPRKWIEVPIELPKDGGSDSKPV